VHPEYWTEADHNRFEDRVSLELHHVKQEVRSLSNRLTYMLGAVAILAFLLPMFAPFLGSLFAAGGLP
jgi:hypothetical protein